MLNSNSFTKLSRVKSLFIGVVIAFGIIFLVKCFSFNGYDCFSSVSCAEPRASQTKIIIITPTYRRATRFADLTRLKNTLDSIPNIYWVVVEDGNVPVIAVRKLLIRSGIPHVYLAYKTKPGYPKRGWYQRDMALQFIRENADDITNGNHGVVYFADDDNSYDTRLFNDYIRNVKKAGVWAVGLVGGAPVETPKVQNGKVVGWHVSWKAERKFAVDMAGFAISLELIKSTKGQFGMECKKGAGAPETCFLDSLGLELKDLEPFGFNQDKKRELLVWHTQSVAVKYDKRKVDMYGFIIE